MLINVYCGPVDNRKMYQVADTDTIQSVMNKAAAETGVNFSRGETNLNGVIIRPGEFVKTFKDFAVAGTAFLVNSPKSDGGLI